MRDGNAGAALRCLNESLAIGSIAGAVSLSADALASAPAALPLAAVLGFACGTAAALILAVGRYVTQLLPAWLALALWCAGGAGLGLLGAVGIGALENLHGQRRLLALVTLTALGAGGAALGTALAFVQSPSLQARAGARASKLRAAVALLTGAAAVAVAVAPKVLRWLAVYPLAMKASVLAAFVLAYASLAALHSARPLKRQWGLLALPLALLDIGALAYLPAARFVPLLGTPQGAQLLLGLRELTDRDGDGSSSLFGGGDCAPENPHIYPNAREIPNNGVDDNCRLGDATGPARPAVVMPPVPSEPSPTSVLLITIDALRADHTQPYGYSRPTTPHLAEFAAGARRYEHAYTAGGRTGIGLVALMGGLPAREQHWKVAPRVLPDRTADRSPWDVVPREWAIAPLPSWLSRRGMRTGAVLHFGAASWFTAGNTFAPYFERYVVAPQREELSDAATVDAALTLLGEFGSSPYFLWVHLFGPHDPHPAPPAEAPDFGTGIVAAYDADIWRTDRELGRLLAAVAQPPGPAPVTIVTADHSEAFAGDRTFHAVNLFDETTRIPLLIRGPGIIPGSDDRIASALDIAPSVLAWTKTPSPYPGESLSSPGSRSFALADVFRPTRKGGFTLEQVVATDGRHRYVVDFQTGREGYALEQNPRDAARDRDVSEAALRAHVMSYVERDGPPDISSGPATSKPTP